MTVEFWYLIGAALVFWMQAGFAMVETGFTRAKNAGNIIMKNLMDFCIGTIVFFPAWILADDGAGLPARACRAAQHGYVVILQSIYSLPHRRQFHRRVRIRIQPCFLRNRRNDSFRRYG